MPLATLSDIEQRKLKVKASAKLYLELTAKFAKVCAEARQKAVIYENETRMQLPDSEE